MIRALALGVVALALVAPNASARRLLGVVPDAAGQVTAPSAPSAPSAHVTAAGAPIAHAANLVYGGGPVLHSNRTHLVFWSPAGSDLGFPPGYYGLTEQFLANVARDSHKPTNVYSLSGQYADSSGPAAYASSYGGASLDTDPLPRSGCHEPLLGGPGWSVCLTDAQLQSELQAFTAGQGLPRTDRDVYFLITPEGLGSCEFAGPDNCALGGSNPGSYCGYHSAAADDRLLYAVIPYNAVPGHCQSGNPRPNGNAADPALSTISHEHNEMVTDPLGDGWIDTAGNENGDLCIGSYGPPLGGSGDGAFNQVIGGGHYYLQAEWSNWTSACASQAAPGSLSLRVAGRAIAGRPVRFVARATAPDRRISTYAWRFGARATGSGVAPRHTFDRPGRYRISVRSTDSAGLWSYASATVAVGRTPTRRSR